ncbi:MAG: branched-chain amino acid ABC transporter permease [Chloroflexi bacterium]|nr:branched-chain amino acid ABC transporter permease [Chloroflexota bacterium]
MSRRHTASAIGLAGLFAVAVAAPRFLGDYVTNMLTLVFLFAALNQSWNVLAGYAGQMSLGHAAFFGVGAYTSTLLLLRLHLTPWLGIIVGGLVAVVFGLIIGYLSFRYGIRGVYFVLITLAFAESLRIIDSNWDVTGGASGLLLPPFSEDFWLAMQFVSTAPYYYLALGMLTLFTAVVAWLSRSPLGLYFTAIRENEEAAAALGVNTLKYKLIAMSISAFMAAMCGTFQAQYISYIDPAITFSVDISIQAILSAVVGGMGTAVGPILGSFVLTPLSQLVEQIVGAHSGFQTVVYGAILIVVTLAAPQGLWPPIQRRLLRPLVERLLPPEPQAAGGKAAQPIAAAERSWTE